MRRRIVPPWRRHSASGARCVWSEATSETWSGGLGKEAPPGAGSSFSTHGLVELLRSGACVRQRERRQLRLPGCVTDAVLVGDHDGALYDHEQLPAEHDAVCRPGPDGDAARQVDVPAEMTRGHRTGGPA